MIPRSLHVIPFRKLLGDLSFGFSLEQRSTKWASLGYGSGSWIWGSPWGWGSFQVRNCRNSNPAKEYVLRQKYFLLCLQAGNNQGASSSVQPIFSNRVNKNRWLKNCAKYGLLHNLMTSHKKITKVTCSNILRTYAAEIDITSSSGRVIVAY